jgi:hypothetical protein
MQTSQEPTRPELAPSIDSASFDTNPLLPTGQLFAQPREWPSEIIVEPARLASGLWGYKEGDIYAAYSADTFPKIQTFAHEGQLFTCGGGSNSFMDCYPLIPTGEYKGPASVPYSHEGNPVVYKGQKLTLGPKIKFVSRELTVPEEIELLRRKYAYGGYFAAGKTYRELLMEYFDDGITEALEAAIQSELKREGLPNTQAEMRAQLGKPSDESRKIETDVSQPTLPGF